MRKARREAEASASRLNLALEAAEAGVYEIDHVGKTFWARPSSSGSPAATTPATRRRCSSAIPGFHADDLPHVRDSFRALHRGDKQSGECFEARIVRPDGTERWVRVLHHLKVASRPLAEGRRPDPGLRRRASARSWR